MSKSQKIKKFTLPQKTMRDIVGIEITACHPEGYPAVRLSRKGAALTVAAAGFLKDLPGEIPKTWEEASQQPSWTLPHSFQAPHAALAVMTSDSFLRQVTQAVESDKFEAHAEAGVRKVEQIVNDQKFMLEAGMPEYQALWISRLLPEGRHPTAFSLQVSQAAALNAILSQPAFQAADGTALAIYVFPTFSAIAAYKQGVLLLYREFALGSQQVHDEIVTKFGIDASLVNAVLDDEVVDPLPVISPLIRPLFRQVEISIDYLLRRHDCKLETFFLFGVPAGATYWGQMFEAAFHRPLIEPPLFDGLDTTTHATKIVTCPGRLDHVFLSAYGAARAVMEDAS